MRYMKAQDMLPEEVIRMIQEYVDGEFLYIPRKEGKRKAWGEKSGAISSLLDRDRRIFLRYKDGMRVSDLSLEFYLSEQSIRRAIGREKARCSQMLHNDS